MKKITNLIDFKNILPYASETFGVYQPLLGWKSQKIMNWINKGFLSDKDVLITKLQAKFQSVYNVAYNADKVLQKIERILPGEPVEAKRKNQSIVLQAISEKLPPLAQYKDSVWDDLLSFDRLKEILNTKVVDDLEHWYKNNWAELRNRMRGDIEMPNKILEGKINDESIVAGILLYLKNEKQYPKLKDIFYKKELDLASVTASLKYNDPFEMIDPKKELDRVGLSPIGIVHLFRQYFFEFDTFLGTPVGHIWLSPGSSVELIEISTRKTITERTTESFTETILKTEKGTTEEDEISDAVKTQNRNETKFGASVSGSETFGISEIASGTANQSASFDLANMQETAREQTHKHMRQQTEKLSTEIRKNFKSTFKTITEVTDTSSKRYVLNNGGTSLINYELRRKMRQVGVQVQDIGTYLCWQTYVDDPGKALGVSELMHIVKSPDLDNIPHPELIVPLKQIVNEIVISIPFVGRDTDDNDQAYTDGSETEVAAVFDETEHIQADFPQEVVCEQANYVLGHVELFPQGADAVLSVRDKSQDPGSNKAKYNIHLDHVDFKGQDSFSVKVKLTWDPIQDLNAIKAANEKKEAEFKAKEEAAYKKEFVAAAKERINMAANIQPRKYEDLREEERIVVYRKLIQEFLMKGIPMPNDRTRHVVAELINSIFDVDKMLYFVAPEWWKPRPHSHLSFGQLKPTGKTGADGKPEMVPETVSTISGENIVGWGGVNSKRPDNYYITDNSVAAKLGSSLGWLLQMDGDNLRNAFLNAPWVKAVIPIRPGKEKAAINWLKQVDGMNGIGPGDMYTGNEPELQGKTMAEVLEILAEKVAEKHKQSFKVSDIPDPDNPTDTENTVSATPVDKVYEHGFYLLQGGFRSKVGEQFEIFDQWVEILPTDQVVAVEVKYDPKTGRQM